MSKTDKKVEQLNSQLMERFESNNKEIFEKASQFISASDFYREHPDCHKHMMSLGRNHPACSHMKTKSDITEEDVRKLADTNTGEDFINKHRVAASKAIAGGYLVKIIREKRWFELNF